MRFATSTEVVFLSAKRTPFGTFGGALRDTSATDLGVIAAKAALERSQVDPSRSIRSSSATSSRPPATPCTSRATSV
jgi:acetyl-CoA acetyltransferase